MVTPTLTNLRSTVDPESAAEIDLDAFYDSLPVAPDAVVDWFADRGSGLFYGSALVRYIYIYTHICVYIYTWIDR